MRPNPITRHISWECYAIAFEDVGISRNDLTSPWDALYFDKGASQAASKGNCFGMCLEAIYAWKNKSLYYKPLAQFDWSDRPMQKEINIKCMYQMGEEVLSWLLVGISSGSTHNPIEVFDEARRLFTRENPPIIWVSKTLARLEKSHYLLPYHFQIKGNIATIKVYDPNISSEEFENRESRNESGGMEISINIARNEFIYTGADGDTYRGDRWRGARLYYVPWNIVDSLQHVPTPMGMLWESIDVILGGDSVETVSLTNTSGNNLDIRKLKKGESPRNKFVPFSMGDSESNPELLMRLRRGKTSNFTHKVKGRKNGKMTYASRQDFSEYILETSIIKDEQMTIRTKSLGSTRQQIKCMPQKAKIINLTYFVRHGKGDDVTKFTFKNLSVSKEKGLKFNLKPGFEGIDLVGLNNKSSATMEVVSRIGGKRIKKQFKLQGYTGARITPTSFAADNKLTVSHIRTVNGAIRGRTVLLDQ